MLKRSAASGLASSVLARTTIEVPASMPKDTGQRSDCVIASSSGRATAARYWSSEKPALSARTLGVRRQVWSGRCASTKPSSASVASTR